VPSEAGFSASLWLGAIAALIAAGLALAIAAPPLPRPRRGGPRALAGLIRGDPRRLGRVVSPRWPSRGRVRRAR
jgi:hypothetical protein